MINSANQKIIFFGIILLFCVRNKLFLEIYTYLNPVYIPEYLMHCYGRLLTRQLKKSFL